MGAGVIDTNSSNAASILCMDRWPPKHSTVMALRLALPLSVKNLMILSFSAGLGRAHFIKRGREDKLDGVSPGANPRTLEIIEAAASASARSVRQFVLFEPIAAMKAKPG